MVKSVFPMGIYSHGISGRAGAGGWLLFGAEEDRIYGESFFEACSEDGEIHVRAACPEEEEGGLVPAGQFFEG